MEAQVLEQDDGSRAGLGARRLYVRPDTIIEEDDRPTMNTIDDVTLRQCVPDGHADASHNLTVTLRQATIGKLREATIETTIVASNTPKHTGV